LLNDKIPGPSSLARIVIKAGEIKILKKLYKQLPFSFSSILTDIGLKIIIL